MQLSASLSSKQSAVTREGVSLWWAVLVQSETYTSGSTSTQTVRGWRARFGSYHLCSSAFKAIVCLH